MMIISGIDATLLRPRPRSREELFGKPLEKAVVRAFSDQVEERRVEIDALTEENEEQKRNKKKTFTVP